MAAAAVPLVGRGKSTVQTRPRSRTAEGGGLYWSHQRGLSLGCPLSPIMGAFFLREVDEQLTAMGLFYVRFMDDIVVLTPTRWAQRRRPPLPSVGVIHRRWHLTQRRRESRHKLRRGGSQIGRRKVALRLAAAKGALRRAVARLNQMFAALALQKHPDKTFIGRSEKGFDFLGYRLWPDRIAVAEATAERFRARLTQLYEQERGRGAAVTPLGSYVRRWLGWATGGVAVPMSTPVAPQT